MDATKLAVANALVIDPAQLTKVKMRRLPQQQLSKIADQVEPKQCYVNSISAGLALGAEKVVLGAVHLNAFGIPVEHSWIEYGNGHAFDPTYQTFDECFKPKNDYQYFKLYEIPLQGYLDIAERIRGVSDMAVDFLALRRSPVTKHLFEQRQSA